MHLVHDWKPVEPLLRVLWTGGMKLDAIARRVNRPRAAVWYHARFVLHLPSRRAKRSPVGHKRFRMAENSNIAWTDDTFNPWLGCTRVSPGCQNCYAEQLMDRRYRRVKWGPGQPRMRTKTWGDPVKFNRTAEKEGIRRKVFCASLADWLDDEVPHQWREDLIALIESCRWIDWLMLTKRLQNLSLMVPTRWLDNPLPNVWQGVTAENQEYWDLRVPLLRETPAAVRWVSYEPALGPLRIGPKPGVDWLIIGGESDQMAPAREFKMEWADDLIDQCRARGVVPFMKQIGSNVTWLGRKVIVPSKAGDDPAQWHPRLRVRGFPPSVATKEWAEGRVPAGKA
jgi:protein gp37